MDFTLQENQTSEEFISAIMKKILYGVYHGKLETPICLLRLSYIVILILGKNIKIKRKVHKVKI